MTRHLVWSYKGGGNVAGGPGLPPRTLHSPHSCPAFDVPEELKDLRKKLLYDFNIFTGESKPNVIRLLPSLAITRKQADEFLDALQEAIEEIKSASAVEAE